MKVVSVIGTRPQYIKFKPLYDTLLKCDRLKHIVIDTKQHYSYDVSLKLINDLKIKINYSLDTKNLNEIDFITNCTTSLFKIISKIKPSLIVTLGDTNTTFCTSLVANKLNIPLAHVEAGERSGTDKPEEINRQYCDSISKLHFCSAERHMSNVRNPIYTGDLEYELLNNINPVIEYQNFGFMTLHRQENMSIQKIKGYFDFISKLPNKIIFPIHHRTKMFIAANKIELPKNLDVCNSMSYTAAVKAMSKCKFIITDSGGIQKCSPFFGKKCLVLRSEGDEWLETYSSGYSQRVGELGDNHTWLVNNNRIKRNTYFYCKKEKLPSLIIMDEINKL